mmetsp:Transcript_38366/g.120812  ORF Transcript_38366/g.120812 Transcript_38366/m.120812 type:complete len:261 (+) Transcript_38366:1462-2244(+)
MTGLCPSGSPRPHLFRYSPPADGAKPQRLELDSPRSGGESNESFSSGSKKMFRADHSPSRVEAGDDALLRGLKEKLASVEERIDSNQRLLLDSLDITQNVDVDTIQQANERVEKLMQLRQQILIAIEHQKRRSRAPEGDVSSDLILPSISPNKRVEQRRPRPPVAKEGVRLPHIPSSYSSVSPEQEPLPFPSDGSNVQRRMQAGSRAFIERQRRARPLPSSDPPLEVLYKLPRQKLVVRQPQERPLRMERSAAARKGLQE